MRLRLRRADSFAIHMPGQFKWFKYKWIVKAEQERYNLAFRYRYQAEAYKRLLRDSVSIVSSVIKKIDIDEETGLIATSGEE